MHAKQYIYTHAVKRCCILRFQDDVFWEACNPTRLKKTPRRFDQLLGSSETLGRNTEKHGPAGMVLKPYPDTQCMLYLPTFTTKINQMWVNNYAIHWVFGIHFSPVSGTYKDICQLLVNSTKGFRYRQIEVALPYNGCFGDGHFPLSQKHTAYICKYLHFGYLNFLMILQGGTVNWNSKP